MYEINFIYAGNVIYARGVMYALPHAPRRSGAPRSGEPGTHSPRSLGSITAQGYGFRAPAFGRPRNDGLRIGERAVIYDAQRHQCTDDDIYENFCHLCIKCRL